MVGLIQKMVSLGIPVLGHIGMTPTHILTRSGYHVQGKTNQEKELILNDALALEEAGVFGIVLECVNAQLAKEITERIRIPTIGIGAGPSCDGQILVSYDLLGLYEEIKPKFVKRYAEVAHVMKKAFRSYQEDVMKGKFPGKEHSY
jgi:3-methyl-2-oxobutanoate hydroxymethyltransferase